MHSKRSERGRHKSPTRLAWLTKKVAVRFLLPRELADQLKAQARDEVVSLATWIRTAAVRELRRKKAA